VTVSGVAHEPETGSANPIFTPPTYRRRRAGPKVVDVNSPRPAVWVGVALAVCLLAVIITFAILGGGSGGTGSGY
jgi:hypothetical protein